MSGIEEYISQSETGQDQEMDQDPDDYWREVIVNKVQQLRNSRRIRKCDDELMNV